jgi:hypothetical protein
MPPLMRRALAVATVVYATAGVGSALADAPNPSANIPMTPPAACYTDGTSAACENGVVSALDSARADLELPAYTLPADFDSLPPDEQMFILSNLDRTSYDLPAIAGLSPTLDDAAQDGVANDTDPDPSSYLPQNLDLYGWDSNWAGGFPNAPYAYYDWMYDDGPGSPNIDCQSDGDPGCWGHRDDVLAFSNVGAIVMGGAAGTDGGGNPGYAMTLVATQTSDTSWTTLSYTWAQALADIDGGSGGGGSLGGGGGGSSGGGGGLSGGGGGGSSGGGGGSSGGGSSGGGSSGGGSSGGSGSSSGSGSSGSGSSSSGSSSAGAGGSAPSGPAAGSSGSADSGSLPPAPAPTPAAGTTSAPVAKIASVNARGHVVRFVLNASGPLSGYECALVRGSRSHSAHPRYASCGAVRVYRHLHAGRYTFFARALGPGGVHRAAAKRSFLIR